VNYLAHIYLSGEDDLITLGNFIADGVKGKDYLDYPVQWQRGILLHRAIDSYTDSHAVVRQSTSRLHSSYSHYSGVVVDMYYDHFLARYWERYHHDPLDAYVDKFYDLLSANEQMLPQRIQRIMPYMMRDNWLMSYASLDGLGRILGQMDQRTSGRSKMRGAIVELEAYYEEFHAEFRDFFDDLVIFSRNKLKTL
jgi:acyl carrier protein phosphodiesterase